MVSDFLKTVVVSSINPIQANGCSTRISRKCESRFEHNQNIYDMMTFSLSIFKEHVGSVERGPCHSDGLYYKHPRAKKGGRGNAAIGQGVDHCIYQVRPRTSDIASTLEAQIEAFPDLVILNRCLVLAIRLVLMHLLMIGQRRVLLLRLSRLS